MQFSGVSVVSLVLILSGSALAQPQVAANAVDRAPLHQPATLSADVPLAGGSTPALRFGGWLELLLASLGVVGWILGIRRPKGIS